MSSVSCILCHLFCLPCFSSLVVSSCPSYCHLSLIVSPQMFSFLFVSVPLNTLCLSLLCGLCFPQPFMLHSFVSSIIWFHASFADTSAFVFVFINKSIIFILHPSSLCLSAPWVQRLLHNMMETTSTADMMNAQRK